MTEFFGGDRNLRDVSPGYADAWLVSLRTKYAPATVGRTVKHARQFFRSAARHGVIRDNPFVEIKAPRQANTARGFFVTPESTKLVLDACPDAEWRLIVALSRNGGLRCPSEHLRLEWCDVDWERDRFLVRSPKK